MNRRDAAAARVLPPGRPGRWVARARVDQQLDEATRRRLTLVVGSAGTGKTAALAAWAHDRRAAWYSVEEQDRGLPAFVAGLLGALRLAVPGLSADLLAPMSGGLGPEAARDEDAPAVDAAGALAAALRERMVSDITLVLDDVDELGPEGPSIAFLEALCRQLPRGVHLVLAGREEPPFPVERLRGRGDVAEIGAAELCFTPDEVTALVGMTLGEAGDLSTELHALTGGWPAVVVLALESLEGLSPHDRGAALTRLRGRSGLLQRYLVAEVLEQEPQEVRQLLGDLAPLPSFDARLAVALGHPKADEVLSRLADRGALVQHVSPPGWYRLTTLAREVLAGAMPARRHQTTLRRALSALEERGEPALALLLCSETGDTAAAVRLLVAHGSALTAAGHVDLVVRTCTELADEQRTPELDLVYGEALQVQGRWDDALACFSRAATGRAVLPPGLVWRIGLIHYFRGDLDDALAVFEHEVVAEEGADTALHLAWWAAALWRKGEEKTCRERAAAAFEAAQACGDDRALAAAHTALAMVAALEGDRRGNDAHYLLALDAAARAGDVLQEIRIRTNRASHFLDEGFYGKALAEAEIAVGLAGPTGYATFHSFALNNRGEAALHLGRLEEAIADFRAAQDIEQRIGARTVSYPLLGLGDVYRLRGDLTQARSAYLEAIQLADEVDDVQVLVPARAGLALTMLEDDPQGARASVQRALAAGPGMGRTHALVAGARVALALGDREEAAKAVRELEELSAARRDRPGMAEGLELRAALEPDAAVPLLEEAVGLWSDIGDPVRLALARSSLAQARGGPAARAMVEASDDALRQLGVRARPGLASVVAEVEVRSLGGFRLAVGGQAVPVTAWQSRKARDLLRILVARRGRPTGREQLIDHLWPGEDPERIANRLSVALSTVRTVLDPERSRPLDWFVPGDKTTVGLDLEHVWLDVEEFLSGAEAGLRARTAGETEEARRRLAAVEPLYLGEFCEDDPYADWAVAVREQARATYVAVARALAEDHEAAGDHDAALRLWLRVLERDPYDEPANLRLVAALTAAGRHGEARRHYRTYAGRMAELGVEAAPFPS